MMQRSILIVLPFLVLAALWGCDNDTSNNAPEVTGGTCLGCHTSQTELENALGEKVVLGIPNKDDG